MQSGKWGPIGAVVLLLTLGGAASARAQTGPCEASTTVKQALRTLSDRDLDAQAQLVAFRDLLKRFPNDLFVHQRYQDAAAYPTVTERDAVIAEYRALAGKHPKDRLFEFLAARATIGANTKQVVPDLERLAARVPSAHLSLIGVYQSTAFKDAAKAREHMDAFMKACPATLTVYQYLNSRSLEPSDFVRSSTERLRALLQPRTDRSSISYYSFLWSLEFRVRPVTEHDQLRKVIAGDLKRLRALGRDDRGYYGVLQQGYKLTNDSESAQWAAGQMARFNYSGARDLWSKDHPYPKAGDPPEAARVFNEAIVKASSEWVRKWPNSVSAWFDRVNALMAAERPAPADVEAAGEGVLNAVAKSPGQMSFGGPRGSSFSLVVAYLYATHGVATNRLPDLVARGIEDNDSPTAGSLGLPSDLSPPDPAAPRRESPFPWVGRVTAVDVWVKVKDADRARKVLLELQPLLDASKPKSDSKDPTLAAGQRLYLSHQQDYWSRLGDLAKLEGRKTDAMTFYQNAMFARPAPPASGAKDELAEKARALWTELGGSNEGRQAWFTSRRDILGAEPASAGLSWTTMEKALPAFELGDLVGGKLRLADFKGKTTLVGIWATW